MPRIMTIEDFKKLREEARRDIRVRSQTGTKIIIGMGTCGIAAGARESMRAILEELNKRKIDAHVTTVGCIGMCAFEPLVDIEQAGGSRITYGNIHPEKVPRLIDEHLIQGRVIDDWVVARLPQTARESKEEIPNV
ncbi:MAG: (2Fe-2S) ferredoxin domain-containing protein [Desulfobacterales bacterium]